MLRFLGDFARAFAQISGLLVALVVGGAALQVLGVLHGWPFAESAGRDMADALRAGSWILAAALGFALADLTVRRWWARLEAKLRRRG